MKHLAILVALVAVAHADDKAKAISRALSGALSTSPDADTQPPIVLLDSDTMLKKEVFIYGSGSPTNELLHVVVGLAADGHAGWIAADTDSIIVCGMGDCDKIRRKAEREADVKPPFHH